MINRVVKFLVVFICFATAIFLLLAQYNSPNLEKYVTKHGVTQKLQYVFDNAENGDIILMSGDTRGERLCKFCSRSIFSHIGVLFWEEDPATKEKILYILDCDLGQQTKSGVRVMSLENKLDRYKGNRIGGLMKLQGKRPTRDEIVGLLSKYAQKDFDNHMITWIVSDIPPLYYFFQNPKKMFCSEFVASVYQDMNIIKKDNVPFSYSPGNFYRNEINFNNGYSLSDCIFFEFEKVSIPN